MCPSLSPARSLPKLAIQLAYFAFKKIMREYAKEATSREMWNKMIVIVRSSYAITTVSSNRSRKRCALKIGGSEQFSGDGVFCLTVVKPLCQRCVRAQEV